MIWMAVEMVDGDRDGSRDGDGGGSGDDGDGDDENDKMVKMAETVREAVDNGNRQ
jgi:hypothetical protein